MHRNTQDMCVCVCVHKHADMHRHNMRAWMSTTTMQDSFTHSPVRVALPRCTRCTLLYTEESYSICRQEEGERRGRHRQQYRHVHVCMCARSLFQLHLVAHGKGGGTRRATSLELAGEGNKRRRFSAPLVPARAHSRRKAQRPVTSPP